MWILYSLHYLSQQYTSESASLIPKNPFHCQMQGQGGKGTQDREQESMRKK